jgi:large subunit ribosomal protein L17
MRHRKHTFKIGKTGTHRRAMIANMLKSLIIHKRIETTVTKAKEVRRYADKMVTLAKKNDLSARRKAISTMRIEFNSLSPKEMRQAKEGNKTSYNADRRVIDLLFGELREKFQDRQGGYTRIIKKHERVGDNAQTCYLEYI